MTTLRRCDVGAFLSRIVPVLPLLLMYGRFFSHTLVPLDGTIEALVWLCTICRLFQDNSVRFAAKLCVDMRHYQYLPPRISEVR